MDWIKFPDKIKNFCRKYKYVFLIFTIGIILMCFPKSTDTAETGPQNASLQETNEESMEDKMARILGKISGAGNVCVMLTDRVGAETVYQTDTQESLSGENQSIKTETVIVGSGSAEKTCLVRQINPPAYLGAVVVCQGADNPQIRLAIVDAVSKLTGLGANCISVLKMK